MTEENQIEFLPFHAINDFMRPDFRLAVLRSVLSSFTQIPQDLRAAIDRLTRQLVKVPGFRQSDKAPAAIKLIPMSKAFENSPELVSHILAAWAQIHTTLQSQVFSLLEKRGWLIFPTEFRNPLDLPPLKDEKDWGVLPLGADRTRLPGFLIYWPKTESFEALYETFTNLFPEAEGSIDEVSLMAVWLSLRLPYQMVEREVSPAKPSPENSSSSITS